MNLPHAFDEWGEHNSDYPVWRRFWALAELRRKWKWADWFYQRVDQAGEEVVAPDNWGRYAGTGYMTLCLWIAFLRTVHEGITETLDPFDTPASERVCPEEVLAPIPDGIRTFPAIKGSPFRDFRNAVFHCQWSPNLAKLDLDDDTCLKLDTLHQDIGEWIEKEFCGSFEEFKKKYTVPDLWLLDPNNSMFPDMF